MAKLLAASVVARLVGWLAAVIVGGLAVAAMTGFPVDWAALRDALVVLLGLGAVIGVAALRRSGRFPQWFFDDEPRIELIEPALSTDQFNTDECIQGLHLTVKNRPYRGRKTKPARDAWLHAIFDGGRNGMKFEPQLLWSTNESGWPPPKFTDIKPNDRLYIPIALKRLACDENRKEKDREGHPDFNHSLCLGATYLMDQQFHFHNPKVVTQLRPNVYSVAVWIEYDGGRMTRRRHFLLRVAKGPDEPNALEVDTRENE